MKVYWTSLFFICLLAILSNCANEKVNTNTTILHPNPDSELTLLMREMYDYYDDLKGDIENGEMPSNIRDFKEIHNAVATEPSKSETPLFKAMSTVYLQSADRLNSSKSNKIEIFNHMIDDCMNCHKQMCPGPMVKIKKLYMADSE